MFYCGTKTKSLLKSCDPQQACLHLPSWHYLPVMTQKSYVILNATLVEYQEYSQHHGDLPPLKAPPDRLAYQ